MFSFLLGIIFPGLSARMPNNRTTALKSLVRSTRGLAVELLDKVAKEEVDVSAGEVDSSILGVLGENPSFLAKRGLLRLT